MPRAKKNVVQEELPKPPVIYNNVIPNREKLRKQYQREKLAAIRVRQSKVQNWLANEQAYNGVVQKTLLTRSNLHVPMVFEGVQNMASKIGAVPEPKYETVPEGDENAAEIMEHVVKEDLHDCSFESIYDESKIEAGITGRTIYEVIPGNDKNRVELVDTLAFLISPIAKRTKKALYMGRQFIYKTREELDEDKEEMEYDKEELERMFRAKAASESRQDMSTDASAKDLRLANLGLSNTKEYGSEVFELTNWWTYVKKGKKAELMSLTVANDEYVIRAKPAKELGLTGRAERFPFFSWGTYPRGITFWCPAVADIYRDPNLATDVSLNQTIDNNTYRNFGMLFVGSSSGLKQSSIVPRPLGITPVQLAPGQTIKDQVWQMPVEEVQSGLTMMNTIKQFADGAAGLAPSGLPPKGKVSVTMQAKLNAEVDAKIMSMRRNATLCCQDMFQFMADITATKLTKPRKVKIFGYKQLTLEGVTKKNFEGVDFLATAVPAEDNQQNKAIKQKAKIDLYTLFKDDPKIPGQIAMRRSVAKTFDIEPNEIESWFTAEEQPDQAMAQAMAQQQQQEGAQQPPQTPQGGKPPTEATPLLGATQQGAQSQVPPAIKP